MTIPAEAAEPAEANKDPRLGERLCPTPPLALLEIIGGQCILWVRAVQYLVIDIATGQFGGVFTADLAGRRLEHWDRRSRLAKLNGTSAGCFIPLTDTGSIGRPAAIS